MIDARLLTVTSLLSIVLFSIHMTDDIVRGISPAGPDNLGGVPILVIWLYGTLLAAGRRSGRIIMLLGGVFAAAMPVMHMTGRGFNPGFAKKPGAFLFILTLFALGATGTLSIILSLRALRAIRGADGTMSAVVHENPDRRG